MEGNYGRALRSSTLARCMAPRTRGVAALHLLPETPNPDSVGARSGVGGWCHWRTPVQHFTSARFGLAVRTAAPGTQVLPTRAPPVPGVPGSLRPLPQGTLHSPGRTQALGRSSQFGYRGCPLSTAGVSAAPGHAYLALDQLHHFGCCGEGTTRVSAEADGNGSKALNEACSRMRLPAFSL